MKPINVGGHTAYQDRYSTLGPDPRLPSDMLRVILVSVEFKLSSHTRFASDLKENYLHAIISGFLVGTLLALALFMTSISAFGYQITTIFRTLSIRPKKSLASPRAKKKKPHLFIKMISLLIAMGLRCVLLPMQ